MLLYDDWTAGSLANGGCCKGRSGMLHLKRATCKSVQTHRCEKLSHTSDVSTFLCEGVGFSDVTLI